jgi:hypothetical protein
MGRSVLRPYKIEAGASQAARITADGRILPRRPSCGAGNVSQQIERPPVRFTFLPRNKQLLSDRTSPTSCISPRFSSKIANAAQRILESSKFLFSLDITARFP